MKNIKVNSMGTAISVFGLAVAIFPVLVIFFTWITMLCWNYLAPTFNMPELGMWQTFVLCLLCSTLFKGDSLVSGIAKNLKK